MYKYTINGQTIRTERELTEAEIDEIAGVASTLRGNNNTDVPTPENLNPPELPYGEPQPEEMSFGETAVESLPAIGGGIGGITGYAVGGPVGGVIGAGTGGGAGAELRNLIQNRPFDPLDTLKEAVTQAAFEGGGTLAVNYGGKVLRYAPSVLKSFGLSTNVDPKMAAKLLISRNAPVAGSRESMAETQRILQEGVPSADGQITATLTRSQIGEAGALRKTMESIGEIGLLGGATFRQNDENIFTILNTRLQTILEGSAGRARSTSDIGELYVGTINDARRTLSNNYGDALDLLKSDFSQGVVNTVALKKQVNKLIEQASRASDANTSAATTRLQALQNKPQLTATELDEIKRLSTEDSYLKWFEGKGGLTAKTQGKPSLIENATLEEYRRILDLPDKVAGDALLDTLKIISRKSGEMLEKGTPGYNSTAAAELTDFVTQRVRPFVEGQLSKINPEAFSKYQALNTNYSKTTKALTPSLLKAAAKRGQREDFSGVGALLVESNNPSYAKKAFDALLEAKKVNKNLNVQEATDALRQGYLLKLIGGEGRDLRQIVAAANKLKTNPRSEEVFNQVLGVSATPVRTLLNAASDASTDRGIGFLALMLRGKEAHSLQLILNTTQALGSASVAGVGQDLASLGTAAAVLATPRIFAKIAMNPKAVNTLLQIDKASSKAKPQAILSNLMRLGNEIGINLEDEMARAVRAEQEATELSNMVGETTAQ